MSIPNNLKQAVFERDKYTCQYCGCTCSDLEVDHIIPVSKGGTDDIRNLATACMMCNRAKGNRILTVEELEEIASKINSSCEYLMNLSLDNHNETKSKVQVSVYLDPETYSALNVMATVLDKSVGKILSECASALTQKNASMIDTAREALQALRDVKLEGLY